MNGNRFKISWILLLLMGAAVIANGLLMAVTPEFFLANEFNGYTGQAWSDFGAANPEPLSFFLLEARQMGMFMITLGVTVTAVVVFAYRGRQKWSWYVILAAVTLGAGSSLITNLPTRDMAVIGMLVVILAVSYVALALGARAVLGGEPEAARTRFAG